MPTYRFKNLFSASMLTLLAALALTLCATPLHAQEGGDAPPPADEGKKDGEKAEPKKEREERRDRGRGRGRAPWGGGNWDEWIDRIGDDRLVQLFDYQVRTAERRSSESGEMTTNKLPFGGYDRMMNRVPVGGIDQLDMFRDGWKVEEIFGVTEEQTASLDGLRKEYDEEMAKFQAKLDEQMKAMALEAIELRKKFELRANDVLTGNAKEEKAKLDALIDEWAKTYGKLSEEARAKNRAEDEVAKAAFAEAREKKDVEQMRGLLKNYAEKTRTRFRGTVFTETSEPVVVKMKETVTGEARDNMTKKYEEMEEGRRDRRGRGGDRGGAKPEAQKPQPAPNDDF